MNAVTTEAENGTGNLIAGTLLTQALLVQLLEDHGVLPQGAYHDLLAKYLSEVDPSCQDTDLYQPFRALMNSLPPLAGGRRLDG